MELNNGTGNKALRRGGVAIGQGCIAVGENQTAFGRFPEVPYGDASSDAFVVGGGSSPSNRTTAIRVDKNGEVLIGGGDEVYMMSPDTGDIIPVFMTGTDNRLKKVLIKR